MNCDDQHLIAILEETDSSSEQEVALHLADCSRCQNRLEELAADRETWSDVIVALEKDDVDARLNASGSVVISLDRELSDDMPLQVDSVSLDFLQRPSHPEMLGRIGRYEIERLIGAGGMGIVLKAFDTELHRPVAVKVLAPHLAHNGGARQRFAREAQSAAAVVHENVVPIHNVDAAGKLPFLVMQFVPGDSLQARVDRHGPLSPRETLRIGAQIANGLAAAHEQGLVHRDVKPANVLMEESVDRVLISDFGLARAADDASVTRSGVIAGTPHYMSPEQARGDVIDSRSDLFGLGSVLYFMCTGHPPFRANGAMGVLNRICNDPHRPVDDVNELVPAPLAELIDRLLAKSPGARPATAREVAGMLTSVLHDSRNQSRFRRPKTKLQRSMLSAGLILGVLVIGFAFQLAVQSVSNWGANPENSFQEFSVKQSANDWLGSSEGSLNSGRAESSMPKLDSETETEEEHRQFAEEPQITRPPLANEIVQDEAFDRKLNSVQSDLSQLAIKTPVEEIELVNPYVTWDQEYEQLRILIDEVERHILTPRQDSDFQR